MRSKLDDKLWRVFSEFIRIRDAKFGNGIGKCYTCGKLIHYKDGDAGHYEKRQHENTKYDERNNHLQCHKCNRYDGGRQSDYAEHLIRDYGQGILQELNQAKFIPVFNRDDKWHEEKIKYYKEKVKELKKLRKL